MGGNFRPLPTKCVEKLLQHIGYSKKRTSSSHDQWVKQGSRTIPLWGSESQIPAQHLKTITKNNPTWGLNEIHNWAAKNC
jgi:predicted RNA binding protein YcfA (HicA-like mRNA interferase family)